MKKILGKLIALLVCECANGLQILKIRNKKGVIL
tara:strand:+ start:372 stop:473 length:102 start_codon:yes stop_codon:yes gene_type:complete